MAASKGRECTAAECKQLFEEKDYQYLDVRTQEEFAEAHVPGSRCIPVKFKQGGQMVDNPKFLEQVREAYPDKAKPLLVGCKSGRRGAAAVEILDKDDYQTVINVAGGLDAYMLL